MSNLAFRNLIFDARIINHTVYITSVQLAAALGYSRPEAVTKIFNRNSDEFSPEMSLAQFGQAGVAGDNIRLFSLRGAHLIAMFSRTPVAKEFRRWVLDVLDKEVSQTSTNLPTLCEDDAMFLINMASGCLKRLVPVTINPDDYVLKAPVPPDIQAALDNKALMLAAEAHKIIHRYLQMSIDYSCAIGHPERYIDKPGAMEKIAQTTLEMALTPHNADLCLVERWSDFIAEAAKNYADAVKAGIGDLRKRGIVIGFIPQKRRASN
ncbi:MAG: hypothetical protein NC211_03585 [Alistipes senegalensis]|nr:hypothetical protein [Oxalobacter formigenes]MCM1280900.1 hypothetical protein [Alistipes senegalensis]